MFGLEEPEKPKVNDPLAELDMIFVEEHKSIFEPLTSEVSVNVCKGTSKRERQEMKLGANSLVYGETLYDGFAITLEKIKKRFGIEDRIMQGSSGGGLFYDLGSGSGKCVIAAAIMYNFDVCCGIELLEGLFCLSLDMKAQYDVNGKPQLLERDKDTECEFFQGDFLQVKAKDWRDGDVVFCNSTCFDDTLMQRICDRALMMEKGTFFITVTKRLPSKEDFKIIDHEMHPTSWGNATIYIHQKMSEPHIPKHYDSDEDEH